MNGITFLLAQVSKHELILEEVIELEEAKDESIVEEVFELEEVCSFIYLPFSTLLFPGTVYLIYRWFLILAHPIVSAGVFQYKYQTY
jgi:hypothetical protein